jgi:hypothetical protein
MTKLLAILVAFLGVLAFAFGISLLLAFPVKWLWNATLPELFAFKVIDVWMAWKVGFLCSLLFKITSVNTK